MVHIKSCWLDQIDARLKRLKEASHGLSSILQHNSRIVDEIYRHLAIIEHRFGNW